jgi:hypothetical protein
MLIWTGFTGFTRKEKTDRLRGTRVTAAQRELIDRPQTNSLRYEETYLIVFFSNEMKS